MVSGRISSTLKQVWSIRSLLFTNLTVLPYAYEKCIYKASGYARRIYAVNSALKHSRTFIPSFLPTQRYLFPLGKVYVLKSWLKSSILKSSKPFVLDSFTLKSTTLKILNSGTLSSCSARNASIWCFNTR